MNHSQYYNVLEAFHSAKSILDVSEENLSFTDGAVRLRKAKILNLSITVYYAESDCFVVDLLRVKKFLPGICHSVKTLASDFASRLKTCTFRDVRGSGKTFQNTQCKA